MTQTALTYGQALFDLAQEEGNLQEYYRQVGMVASLLKEQPAFLTLLDCGSIPLKRRLEILDESFRGRVLPYLLNFMKLLCQSGKVRHLPDCLRQFVCLYNKEMGIVEAKVVSAVALTPLQQEKLQKKLESMTGKTVVLSLCQDATLLGGVKISLDGKEQDGTVRRRLDEFGKQLAELVL